MSTDKQFSVCAFFPDGTYNYEARGVEVETAVNKAKEVIRRPAAQIGLIRRVIITDGGDYTNFEWRHGEGVVFPPKDAE